MAHLIQTPKREELHRDEVEAPEGGGRVSVTRGLHRQPARRRNCYASRWSGPRSGHNTSTQTAERKRAAGHRGYLGDRAVVALMVWVVPLATSGVGAEDAIPKAETPWVTLYDDAGNAHLVHAP